MPVLNFKDKNGHEMMRIRQVLFCMINPLHLPRTLTSLISLHGNREGNKKQLCFAGGFGCSIPCACWPCKTGLVSQPLPKLMHISEMRVPYGEGEIFFFFFSTQAAFCHPEPRKHFWSNCMFHCSTGKQWDADRIGLWKLV